MTFPECASATKCYI